MTLLHHRRVRLDRQPFAQWGLACRNQLGRVGDLYQTHPAVRGDREPGMVAVVRNLHADMLGGLDHVRARSGDYFGAVNRAGRTLDVSAALWPEADSLL